MTDTVSATETENVTREHLIDELANVVRRIEHCHTFLRGLSTPVIKTTDELLEITARDAMALLRKAGYSRAPMVEAWPSVMPEGWTGPRDWSENAALDQQRAAARTFTDDEIQAEVERA